MDNDPVFIECGAVADKVVGAFKGIIMVRTLKIYLRFHPITAVFFIHPDLMNYSIKPYWRPSSMALVRLLTFSLL